MEKTGLILAGQYTSLVAMMMIAGGTVALIRQTIIERGQRRKAYPRNDSSGKAKSLAFFVYRVRQGSMLTKSL